MQNTLFTFLNDSYPIIKQKIKRMRNVSLLFAFYTFYVLSIFIHSSYADPPSRPTDLIEEIRQKVKKAQPQVLKGSETKTPSSTPSTESNRESKDKKNTVKAGSPSPDFDPSQYTKPNSIDLPVLKGDQVLIIPIHGTIDRGLPPFIERQLTENPEADLIIFDVDTFGGRVDAATEIRDLILKESRPTVAYVHRRAISAGALISFSAQYLVFSEGATMGAATPIQLNGGQAEAVGEKMVSYFRSEMRSTAEQNGWDGNLAEAMVDRDKEVKGVSPKGKLLTLTTKQAQAINMMNALHPTLDTLLDEMGMKEAKRIQAQTNWAEDVARFFTDPTVSGLLMSVGMLGIMIELYSPGLGLAGLVGLLCLICFFMGHMVVRLAGFEELSLVIVGLFFLGLEIFVIPGFGLAGVVGLTCLAMGLITAMDELPATESWNMDIFENEIQVFVFSLIGTLVGGWLIMRTLPESRWGSWLVLKEAIDSTAQSETTDSSQSSLEKNEDRKGLIGKEGIAQTPLRLSGKGRFEGQVIDVVSQSDYIDAGQQIRIVQVEGARIVVSLIDPSDASIS